MFTLPTKGNYLQAVLTAGAAGYAGIWADKHHKHMGVTILAILVAGAVGYAAGSMLDQATGV
jgi:hypothetical protein